MRNSPGSDPELEDLQVGNAASGAQVLREAQGSGIFLVGFMGAGKTSVGRALAAKLGCCFEDLDDRIQVRESRTVEEIFRDSGEAAFRNAEHAALIEVLQQARAGPMVVALGGGAFVPLRNATLLRQARATVIFLDGPVEELFLRCQEQDAERPLRKDIAQFRKLYEARRPIYMTADLRVPTAGLSVEAIADHLARTLSGPTTSQRDEEVR